MSKDIANTIPLWSSTTPWQSALTRDIASIVERSARKPYWWSWRSELSRDKCPTRQLAITSSNSLLTSSSRQIGLYAEGESGGLPSCRRRISLVFLQARGKLPSLRHLLSRCLSDSDSFSQMRARAQARPGIPLKPGALFLAPSSPGTRHFGLRDLQVLRPVDILVIDVY